MHIKPLLILSAVILAAGSLQYAQAQAMFAGQQKHTRTYAFGAGISDFSPDWGAGRTMKGITATFDTDLPHTTGLLRGFGLQIEGRDLNYDRPAVLRAMRLSTILGGSTYIWPYSRRIRPVAKCLWGIGSIDFPRPDPNFHYTYSHDTRAVSAPGLGLEYRVFDALWVRGDFEYQFWPHLLGAHALNPHGFTVTTVYDFRSRNRNRD